jgi:colanic acid/amylovoran biosynthesis glycosyltransferase
VTSLPSAPGAGQLIGRYLEITENWIHKQLVQLRRFRPVALARRTSNLDRFPLPAIHAQSQLPRWRRALDRAAELPLGYSPTLRAAAQAERVVLLHAHFGPRGVKALPLARSLRVPLVTSFYGFDLGQDGARALARRYRTLFSEGAAFVVEGPAARARLVELGCRPEKVVINRLGVEMDGIAFARRERPSDRPLRVLMAARFTEKKGLTYGVDALCRAARAGADVTATIVGDAGRSPAEQEIKRRLHETVASSGTPERFRFAGRVKPEELRSLMYDHDVFLQPSVHAADGDCEGGLPVALIEAAATGMGLIASDHCDIPDLVRPGDTGWLCPERDVAGLVAALTDCSSDPERMARYAAAARARAEEAFDVRRSRLDDIYAGVSEGRMPA